jgi:hypothetical protein
MATKTDEAGSANGVTRSIGWCGASRQRRDPDRQHSQVEPSRHADATPRLPPDHGRQPQSQPKQHLDHSRRPDRDRADQLDGDSFINGSGPWSPTARSAAGTITASNGERSILPAQARSPAVWSSTSTPPQRRLHVEADQAHHVGRRHQDEQYAQVLEIASTTPLRRPRETFRTHSPHEGRRQRRTGITAQGAPQHHRLRHDRADLWAVGRMDKPIPYTGARWCSLGLERR